MLLSETAQVRDFVGATGLVGFGWGRIERSKELETVLICLPVSAENNKWIAVIARISPQVAKACADFCPTWEYLLASSAFLCGDSPFWVDFQLAHILDYVEEVAPGTLAPFPRCAALLASVNATPAMVDYRENHRKPLVDARYIQEVNAVLRR